MYFSVTISAAQRSTDTDVRLTLTFLDSMFVVKQLLLPAIRYGLRHFISAYSIGEIYPRHAKISRILEVILRHLKRT
jgi:hypothetical protein